jgi:hypothetical protein
MISQRSIDSSSRQFALFMVVAIALAFLVARPAGLCAQDNGSSMPPAAPDAGEQAPPAAQQAATTLSGDQQSAANTALCSAIGSQVPNPAAATPSVLSSPAVISAAASKFAGSTQLPLSSANSLLQGYVAQHATDILASCAVSNAASGVTSKIPGAGSLPSMPQMP